MSDATSTPTLPPAGHCICCSKAVNISGSITNESPQRFESAVGYTIPKIIEAIAEEASKECPPKATVFYFFDGLCTGGTCQVQRQPAEPAVLGQHGFQHHPGPHTVPGPKQQRGVSDAHAHAGPSLPSTSASTCSSTDTGNSSDSQPEHCVRLLTPKWTFPYGVVPYDLRPKYRAASGRRLGESIRTGELYRVLQNGAPGEAKPRFQGKPLDKAAFPAAFKHVRRRWDDPGTGGVVNFPLPREWRKGGEKTKKQHLRQSSPASAETAVSPSSVTGSDNPARIARTRRPGTGSDDGAQMGQTSVHPGPPLPHRGIHHTPGTLAPFLDLATPPPLTKAPMPRTWAPLSQPKSTRAKKKKTACKFGCCVSADKPLEAAIAASLNETRTTMRGSAGDVYNF